MKHSYTLFVCLLSALQMQVGFLYQSVVEDYFTGFWQLYCRGWTSVYCYPSSRPPFLGNVPTNLNDVLVQNKRWMSGLLAVGVSKYCPLTVPKSVAISIPQSMAFAYHAFSALSAFPLVCYATIPQLYFFRGVSLFPKVTHPSASSACDEILISSNGSDCKCNDRRACRSRARGSPPSSCRRRWST